MPVVLFDLMDTLVEDPYHRMFSQNFPLADFRRWKDRRSFVEFEQGEISEAEFFRRYYLPEMPETMRSILPKPRSLKKEMFRFIRPIQEVMDLAREISERPGVSVGVASNYSEWYVHVLARRPEIDALCRYLFFSCELGVRKPDSAYYARIEQALTQAGAVRRPEDIWFIDDRPINVAAAQEAGWHAHTFRTIGQLRGELMESLAEFLFQ